MSQKVWALVPCWTVVQEAKQELLNLRFQNATRSLTNYSRMNEVRHQIACIKTMLRERELGIRATPAPVEAPAKKATKSKAKKADSADDAVKEEAE